MDAVTTPEPAPATAKTPTPARARKLVALFENAERDANEYARQFVFRNGHGFIEQTTQTTLKQFIVEHGGEISTGDLASMLAGNEITTGASGEVKTYKLEPVNHYTKFIDEEFAEVLRKLFHFISDWHSDVEDMIPQDSWPAMYL